MCQTIIIRAHYCLHETGQALISWCSAAETSALSLTLCDSTASSTFLYSTTTASYTSCLAQSVQNLCVDHCHRLYRIVEEGRFNENADGEVESALKAECEDFLGDLVGLLRENNG